MQMLEKKVQEKKVYLVLWMMSENKLRMYWMQEYHYLTNFQVEDLQKMLNF